MSILSSIRNTAASALRARGDFVVNVKEVTKGVVKTLLFMDTTVKADTSDATKANVNATKTDLDKKFDAIKQEAGKGIVDRVIDFSADAERKFDYWLAGVIEGKKSGSTQTSESQENTAAPAA